MSNSTAALTGVFRSLRQYHGANAPKDAMDRLYRQFVRPGDLVFDVGAHVGDRISSFRRLGARVVAFEPNPLLFRALRLIHGRDVDVTLLAVAAAAQSGAVTLHINSANPTVSTVSDAFLEVAHGKPGWEGQTWDDAAVVPGRSLDSVVRTFGAPAFIKIDVEGFEHDVLSGLTMPVAALSFEFTTIARDIALLCLERIDDLGDYGFDVALGESQMLTFERWVSRRAMADHLRNLPHAANSGDVYARRRDLA